MADYTINLSEDDVAKVTYLAKLRGVGADTIVSQAIATEMLIAKNVGQKDELLVKTGDSVSKFNFEN